jgi:hypothetical protein
MYAKILTVHVLIPNDAHVALITDGLNEGFHEGFDPGMILDWAYDDAGPEGITPPTVWVPDAYEEGDFLSHLQPVRPPDSLGACP